jgi:hypothetical protein
MGFSHQVGQIQITDREINIVFSRLWILNGRPAEFSPYSFPPKRFVGSNLHDFASLSLR